MKGHSVGFNLWVGVKTTQDWPGISASVRFLVHEDPHTFLHTHRNAIENKTKNNLPSKLYRILTYFQMTKLAQLNIFKC